MKCPKCMHEIKDDAAFCGYCGERIQSSVPELEKEPEIGPQKEPETKPEQEPPKESETKPELEPPKEPKKRKKHTGFKVWLVFMFLAILSGGILGFLEAKEITNILEYIPKEYMDNFEILINDISEKISNLLNNIQ